MSPVPPYPAAKSSIGSDDTASCRKAIADSWPQEGSLPDFRIEAQFSGPVCGIDDAGRGPWAGPVVAAAAILDPARLPPGTDDSKKLTAARREALFAALVASARIAMGAARLAELARLTTPGAPTRTHRGQGK